MSSETTKRQIDYINRILPDAIHSRGAAWYRDLCQAKLALVQALEIQERMERGWFVVGPGVDHG